MNTETLPINQQSNAHFRCKKLLILLCLTWICASKPSKAIIYTIGTGTSNNSSSGVTPFASSVEDNRIQYIYLASELTAAGAGAGTIQSIGFNITALGSPAPTNVNISIGTTSATTLSALQSGLTTVYTSPMINVTSGWNTFTFNTPFNWSGNDNIIIEVCRDNNASNTNYGIQTSNVNAPRAFGYYANGATGCSMTSGSTSITTSRPNCQFDITTSTPCNGTPAAGTIAPSIQRICNGIIPKELRVSGTTPAGSLTYSWEESDDNGMTDPWTTVTGGTGANSLNYIPPAFAGTTIYYRMTVTCPAAPAPNASSTLSAAVHPVSSPVAQANSILFPASASTSSQLIHWTKGDGSRRYAAINTTNNFTGPVSGPGAPIAANPTYSSSGEQIIYDGTDSTIFVDGLSCNTQYFVRVYEYNRCVDTAHHYFYNTATAAGNPNTFTTPMPAMASLPVSNDFNSYTGSNLSTSNPGWYEAVGGTVPIENNFSGEWENGTLGGSTTAEINLFDISQKEWIISPRIHLAQPSQLSFDAAITDFGSNTPSPTGMQGTDDSVQVLVSTDGCGQMWTPVHVFAAANTVTLTNTLTNFTVNLSAYANQTVQIGFKATDGPVADASDYYFHIDNILVDTISQPLSIKLDQFIAMNSGAVNRIYWSTLSEEPNDRFLLQRSPNGSDFETVHQTGANSKPSRYRYTDFLPLKGINYYRLLIKNGGNNIAYSRTVAVTSENARFDIAAFPNPVMEDLIVKVSGWRPDASIQITDITGRVIRTVVANSSIQRINMNDVAAGVYLVTYSDPFHTHTFRISKR